MPANPRPPTVSTAHRQESIQADRRWLVVWTSLFVAWLAFSAIVVILYRVTGPHPEINAFIRRVKHEVRWLIPFRKIPRNKRITLRLEPDDRGRVLAAGPDRAVRVDGDAARVRHVVG
jgi:hypothetical protein